MSEDGGCDTLLTLSEFEHNQLAPGVTIECRDELWLVTHVTKVTDGWRLRVRGISDYVRNTTATFFTALDHDIRVFDMSNVKVRPDESPRYRHSRLFLESVLRSTPVPMYLQELEVARRMLLDPLDYQLDAVRRALDPSRSRPRVLLADAVGLGKTLEIGMILAELIRRGRGERILVVTPKHVLEQFQQELWTRFAIPLVRLDSQGIQKVRQKLPASKNPFTYFPRAIVSMDTLKSAKYRAQLEKVRWDAVVIDEIHNATNAGSQNNQLARTLAPTTESLILASATPHNGKPESFKEILCLLDPLSVRKDGSIDKEAAQRLIIRRHRNSPEVASKVGDRWAKRLDPLNIVVKASPEELAVAREIDSSWLGNENQDDRLFPYTLLKAYLSSPAALEESIAGRLHRTSTPTERQRLERLREQNALVTPDRSAKFQELKDYLKKIGVGPRSSTRVVIFSERVATLNWLREHLQKDLKMPKGAVKIMHGQLSDVEQMALIDEFKRENTKLRILITGDVASEGVNLHAQCHHLVHYDIPWSLIRIQQRNGRIDRYGQLHEPQITTLLLDASARDVNIGELRVLTRLIEREHSAHELLGDASSLMGKHSVKAEEDAIRDVLAGMKNFDTVVPAPEDLLADSHSGDDIDRLLASLDLPEESDAVQLSEPVKDSELNTLYRSEVTYLEEALDEAFHGVKHDGPGAGGVGYRRSDNGIAEFIPPTDLQRRFDFLPQDYVSYRNIKSQLTLATTTVQGNLQLTAAREGDSEKTWPKAHFLGPLHPVLGWAVDRALSNLRHDEIPAFTGSVAEPTVLVMGTLTNFHGQVVSRAFRAYSMGPLSVDPNGNIIALTEETIEDPYQWLIDVGLGEDAINTGGMTFDFDAEALVSHAVKSAESSLEYIETEQKDLAQQRTNEWSTRFEEWEAGERKTQALWRSRELINQEQEILRASLPEQRLARPLALILPRAKGNS